MAAALSVAVPFDIAASLALPDVENETEPVIATDGSIFLIAWYSETKGFVFERLDAATGEPLDAEGIRLNFWTPGGVTGLRGRTAGVAYGGGKFLVAHHTSSGLAAHLVDPDGTVSPYFVIYSDDLGYFPDGPPVIAWSGSDFIVVFDNGLSVRAARVSASGTVATLSDTASYIGGSPGANLRLACGTTSCLLLFPSTDPMGAGAHAILLNSTTLAETAISDSRLECCRDDVAFDGNDFVAVGRGPFVANELRAERISQTGTLVTVAPVVLGTAPTSARITFSGEEFAVTYGSNVLLLDPALTPRGPLNLNAGTELQGIVGVTTQPAVANGMYFLAWESFTDDLSDIVGRRMTLTGTLPEQNPVRLSNRVNAQTLPSAAFGDTDYLVVWIDDRGDGDGDPASRTYAARVSTDGTVLDAEGIELPDLDDAQRVALASGADSYLLTWRNSSSRYQRVSRAGALLGTFNTLTGSYAVPAFDGSGWLLAYSGVSGVEAQRVDADGNPAGALIPIYNRGAEPDTIRVACDTAGECLVLWRDLGDFACSSSALECRSAFAWVHADGSVTQAGTLICNNCSGMDANLSYGDGGFLVSWNGNNTTHTDIHAARYQGGTRSEPLFITQAATNQQRSQVAFMGSRFLVAWFDAREVSRSALYANRTFADGVRLDADGFAVISGRTIDTLTLAGGPGQALAAYIQRGSGGTQQLRGQIISDDPGCDGSGECASGGSAAGGSSAGGSSGSGNSTGGTAGLPNGGGAGGTSVGNGGTPGVAGMGGRNGNAGTSATGGNATSAGGANTSGGNANGGSANGGGAGVPLGGGGLNASGGATNMGGAGAGLGTAGMGPSEPMPSATAPQPSAEPSASTPGPDAPAPSGSGSAGGPATVPPATGSDDDSNHESDAGAMPNELVENDGGCACRLQGKTQATPSTASFFLLGLGLLFALRRRARLAVLLSAVSCSSPQQQNDSPAVAQLQQALTPVGVIQPPAELFGGPLNPTPFQAISHCTATQCAAMWQQAYGDHTALVLRVTDASGEPVAPPQIVVDGQQFRTQLIAHEGGFLALFSASPSFDILGRRYGSNGLALDPAPFLIHAANSSLIFAATVSTGTLVAANNTARVITGNVAQFPINLGVTGNVLDALSAGPAGEFAFTHSSRYFRRFSLSTSQQLGDELDFGNFQIGPSGLAFDGTNYVIVRRVGLDGSELGMRASRVRASDGALLDVPDEFNQLPGGSLVIDGLPGGGGSPFEPKVSFDGQYVVALWRAPVGGGVDLVQGVRLNGSTLSRADGLAVTTPEFEIPHEGDVAHYGTTGGSLNGSSFRRLSINGSGLPEASDEYLLSYRREDDFAMIDAALSGSVSAALAHDKNLDVLTLVRFDASTGQPLDPTPLSVGTGLSGRVTGDRQGGFMVVYEDNGRVHGTVVTNAGAVLPSFQIDQNLMPAQARGGAVASDGERYLVTWVERATDPDVAMARRYSLAGEALDAVPLQMWNTDGVGFRSPEPAANFLPIPSMRTFLVVYGVGNQISFRRIRSETGVLLPQTSVIVTSDPTGVVTPRIASDGNDFVVLYRNTEDRLWNVIVDDIDGTVMNTLPDRIINSTGAHIWRLAHDGSQFVASWIHDPSGALLTTRLELEDCPSFACRVVMSTPPDSIDADTHFIDGTDEGLGLAAGDGVWFFAYRKSWPESFAARAVTRFVGELDTGSGGGGAGGTGASSGGASAGSAGVGGTPNTGGVGGTGSGGTPSQAGAGGSNTGGSGANSGGVNNGGAGDTAGTNAGGSAGSSGGGATNGGNGGLATGGSSGGNPNAGGTLGGGGNAGSGGSAVGGTGSGLGGGGNASNGGGGSSSTAGAAGSAGNTNAGGNGEPPMPTAAPTSSSVPTASPTATPPAPTAAPSTEPNPSNVASEEDPAGAGNDAGAPVLTENDPGCACRVGRAGAKRNALPWFGIAALVLCAFSRRRASLSRKSAALGHSSPQC